MYVCFCLPNYQMTLQPLNGRLMAWWRLRVSNKPDDPAVWGPRGCLCLAERVCSLPEQSQEQRYGCVSRRAGSRSVQECHLGSRVGNRPSMWHLTSCVEAHGFCVLMPKPCGKLNPALTTASCSRDLLWDVHSRDGLLPAAGAPGPCRNIQTTAVKKGELLMPTVI